MSNRAAITNGPVTLERPLLYMRACSSRLIRIQSSGIISTVPTLVREEGFEVRIYTLDHPPPHVHVARAGAIVKISLSNCQATEIAGAMSDRDVKRAEEFGRTQSSMVNRAVAEISWQPVI